MVLTTLMVGAAVTPSVIETALSHYMHRKPLRGKPTAHISYDEGLHLIRQFLEYASSHTVDDVQAFTAQWVPTPRWVKVDDLDIPAKYLSKAADIINAQLGPSGIERVGGLKWWQWRIGEPTLQAEWIEMRKDYNARKARGDNMGQRIFLYIHGGAYFFGGVDEHRYQIQRHARKLQARVLAPRYRLAPQFPFPCGLHDCIASYLFLLDMYSPRHILIGGDSAGGGMTLGVLVCLRDQGVPLPAGTILLSPWSDLTHSFPSVSGDGAFDYIPANGFHHKPSMSWPPPNAIDMKEIGLDPSGKPLNAETSAHTAGAADGDKKAAKLEKKQKDTDRARGFSVMEPSAELLNAPKTVKAPTPGKNLSIMIDGQMIEIIDQIQMYATNSLLSHPLVSPVLQPSLGGLPPMLVQAGGGELLLDEQIYLAHKAANPTAFPPGKAVMEANDPEGKILKKYPPTDVYLQVWEDMCHVGHTLSFTRPAKFMYRGVAQFGSWCYAKAQNKDEVEFKDDASSIISNSDDEDLDDDGSSTNPSLKKLDRKYTSGSIPVIERDPNDPTRIVNRTTTKTSLDKPVATIGSRGDPIPPFKNHMIRQRIDRHGVIFPLAPPSSLEALQMDPETIGVIKQGPVRKWRTKKEEWETKYASTKRKVQKQRAKEIQDGYASFGPDENPPPTALAGRRTKAMEKMMNKKRGKSWGLAMWSGWGSKHDETTLDNQEDVARSRRGSGSGARGRSRGASRKPEKKDAFSRAQSEPRRQYPKDDRKDVDPLDIREVAAGVVGTAGVGAAAVTAAEVRKDKAPASQPLDDTNDVAWALPPGEKVPGSDNTIIPVESARPHNGEVAYPFKLRPQFGDSRPVSMQTLDSLTDRVPPMDGAVEDKAVEGVSKGSSLANGATKPAAATASTTTSEPQRPPLETFVTAREF
ncbi:hypothetical protein MBLNU457_4240t2 [Dothideomycetes sp. NU457]